MGSPRVCAGPAADLHPAPRLRPAAIRTGQRSGAQGARCGARLSHAPEDGVRGLRLRLDLRRRLRDRAGAARRDLSESRPARSGTLSRARHSRHGLHGFLYEPARLPSSIIRSRMCIAAMAASAKAAGEVLRQLPGVAEVLDRDAQVARGLHHARSGDLLASPRMARGSPIRGLRRARRRTTRATSIFTTSPATIRANFSSAGRRAA